MRELIFAACMCAVLNTGVRLLSPGKFRKEMKMICTLMLILCLAAKVSGGFRIDAGDFFSDNAARGQQFTGRVLEDTEQSLKERLGEELALRGIEGAETVIECEFDEYNYVRAEAVHIHLPRGMEEDRQAAAEAATELFPGAETEVTAGDEDTDRLVPG